jgi:uncharacterized protein YhaN
MRLTSLALTNYGVFQSTRIAFDPAPGRINLLIAPNGAGKSILRSAFCDLLFGIGGQTPMGFRYGYPNMRLTAEAVTENGSFVFGRRKGQGNTLIDGDGIALDGATIGRLLGRTDLALLERLFALDTEKLRLGGQALLASGGELADALLSAAGGLRGSREVRVKLEAARDALAPERKSQNRPFYQALDSWLDARKRASAATLKPELRDKQELELTALRNEHALQTGLHKRALRNLARLERVRRVRGALGALDQQAAWLAVHPDAPVLPAEAGTRLDTAERLLREAGQAAEHATATRAGIAVQQAQVVVDDALIDAGAEVDRLASRAGAMDKAATDRPARQAEHAAAAGRIEAMLRQLGAKAEDAIPPLPAIARARHLLSAHDRLRADLDRLPREAAAKDAEAAKTTAELGSLEPTADMRGLNRLVREIGADPAARATEAARAVAQRHTALEQALRRVPGWANGAEALADLRPLPLSEYERFAAHLRDAGLSSTQVAADLAAARTTADTATARLAALSGDGPIPDAAAVDAARQTRDAGWALICRRLFGDGPDVPAERAWAGDLPLALAYERALAAADDLADRRGGEAERVERAAELRRQIATAATAVQARTTQLAEAEEECAHARTAWATASVPLQLAPDAGLPALRDLLAGRERVMDALRDLAIAEEAQAALLAQHSDWAARLAIALNEPANDDPTALPARCVRAEDAIDLAARTEKARTRLETRRATARQDADRLSRELTEATGRRTRWQAEWTQALAALGRPADEDPDITRALLDVMTDLVNEQQNAAQLAKRLRDMREDMEAFRADVAAAARRLAPDIADADAFEIVRALRKRLTEQQKAAQRRDTLQAQLADCDRKLAKLSDDLVRHQLAFRAALENVGAETMEAARQRVALAAERTRAEAAHREAERELRDKGDGIDTAGLQADVAGIAPDDVPAGIEAAERDRDAAMVALQGLAARIATGQADLDRQAHEIGAEAAAAEQETALARIGRILDEAALQHLAAAMLDTALDTVGSAGAPAVLGRIGTLFSTVTAGAYHGIAAEAGDDGSAHLVARERGYPDEPKQIAQLSEGTRDQLFLALRIAAIEDHAHAAPSPPFIGDDILQTFDDDRALAAMQALLELSRTTQVILLSHHRHLLDVAARLPDGYVRICAPVPPTA